MERSPSSLPALTTASGALVAVLAGLVAVMATQNMSTALTGGIIGLTLVVLVALGVMIGLSIKRKTP